jgi:hypothetical protein
MVKTRILRFKMNGRTFLCRDLKPGILSFNPSNTKNHEVPGQVRKAAVLIILLPSLICQVWLYRMRNLSWCTTT